MTDKRPRRAQPARQIHLWMRIRAHEQEGLLKRALFISSLSANAILNTFDTVARPLPGSFATKQAW
jgi:hypothetical protein